MNSDRRRFKEGDREARHLDPVWRAKADFIIATLLNTENGISEWEQIWAKKMGGNTFIVCCIPFFAYNISLGDLVKTNDDYVIERVLAESGNTVFRIWFLDYNNLTARADILNSILDFGVEMEWSSDNLLAISVNDSKLAQNVADYLMHCESEGRLVYDTGRQE